MKDALPFLCAGFLMGLLCGFCMSLAWMQREESLRQQEALEQGYTFRYEP